MEENNEIKVIFLHDAVPGVTSIIKAAIEGIFNENEPTTPTCGFLDIYIEYYNKKYHLELWDTLGQKQFRKLTDIF